MSERRGSGGARLTGAVTRGPRPPATRGIDVVSFFSSLFTSGGVAAERLGTGPVLKTERLLLRPPRLKDYAAWSDARRRSREHLTPWEPAWSPDHLTITAFRRRVAWTTAEIRSGRSYPLFVFLRDPRGAVSPSGLIGGVTLEHVRRGAAQSAALGYWLSVEATGRGYMGEAIQAVVDYAFSELDLSRLEAACVAHNFRSRHVLERAGFHREGLARNYLQIDGVWRDHILYERRRRDRLD